MDEFRDVYRLALDFRQKRDWKQFHDPKNLSEAISIEAGELLEHFLWKTTTESKNLSVAEVQRIADEMADVFIFLLYLSAELKIDILSATRRKIEINETRYPTDKSKGTNTKYTDL